MIRAPVLDCALDVVLRLELAVKSPAYQIWHFIVGREADGDQLRGGQLTGSATKIARQHSFEAGALLDANNPILGS
jgi:hypothetical protein